MSNVRPAPLKPLHVSVGRFSKDVSGGRTEQEVRANVDAWIAKGLRLNAPLPEKSGPGSVSPLWLMLSTNPPRHKLVWEYIDKYRLDPTRTMDALGCETLLSAAASRSVHFPFIEEWVKRGLPLEPPTSIPHTALGAAVCSNAAGIEIIKVLSEAGASWSAPHQTMGWDKKDQNDKPMWRPIDAVGKTWNLENAPVWTWALRKPTMSLLKYMEEKNVIPVDLSNQWDLFAWMREQTESDELFVEVAQHFSKEQQHALIQGRSLNLSWRDNSVSYLKWVQKHVGKDEFKTYVDSFLTHGGLIHSSKVDAISFAIQVEGVDVEWANKRNVLIVHHPELFTAMKKNVQTVEVCENILGVLLNHPGLDADASVVGWKKHGVKWAHHYASLLKKEGKPTLSEQETRAKLEHTPAEGLLKIRPFVDALIAERVFHPKGVWGKLGRELEWKSIWLEEESKANAQLWMASLERSILMEKHQPACSSKSLKAL